MNLSEAIGEFIEARQAERLSPHTISDYTNTYNKFLAWHGDASLGEIDAQAIRRFMASREGLAKKTLLNYHTGLSSLWTWLVANGLADHNIVHMVKAPRPEIREIVPYTRSEVASLLAATQAGQHPERDQAIVLALLDTGMRSSELCGLRYRDVRWQTRIIIVMGKGSKERYLQFGCRTMQAILEYTRPAHSSAPLFGLAGRDALRQLMERLGRRAGVPGVHAHRFRHTFAIEFLRNGGNVYVLQKILGHTTLDMVKRYLNLVSVDITKQMDRASPVRRWRL